MKKTTIYLLVIIALILLGGCSAKQENADVEPSSELIVESTAQPLSNNDFEETATPEPLSESVARWEEDTFISEWGDFKIVMPDGWYKATDEEIVLVQNLGEEVIAGADSISVEELENINYVYPMMISKFRLDQLNEEFNINMILVFEKLNTVSSLLVNGESYLEIIKNQYEELDLGYEIPEPINDVKINGEKFYKMSLVHKEGGIKQTIVCRKHKGFIIAIIISAAFDDQAEIDMLLDCIDKN